MADEARKAGFSAYSSWYGQYETGGVRQAFDSGFDAGVAEGIRMSQAAVREVIANEPEAGLGAMMALGALDFLEANRG